MRRRGGGQATILGSVAFANASGGVASLTLSVLDATGAALSTTTTPVAGGSGMTSGAVQGTVVANTSVVGVYTFRVSLLDLAGNASNALSGPSECPIGRGSRRHA
jgi:hypothetical protein